MFFLMIWMKIPGRKLTAGLKKIIEMVDYGNVSIEEEIKEKTEN